MKHPRLTFFSSRNTESPTRGVQESWAKQARVSMPISSRAKVPVSYKDQVDLRQNSVFNLQAFTSECASVFVVCACAWVCDVCRSKCLDRGRWHAGSYAHEPTQTWSQLSTDRACEWSRKGAGLALLAVPMVDAFVFSQAQFQRILSNYVGLEGAISIPQSRSMDVRVCGCVFWSGVAL